MTIRCLIFGHEKRVLDREPVTNSVDIYEWKCKRCQLRRVGFLSGGGSQ